MKIEAEHYQNLKNGCVWENKTDNHELAIIHFISRCGGRTHDYNVTFHISNGETFTVSLVAFLHRFKYKYTQLELLEDNETNGNKK